LFLNNGVVVVHLTAAQLAGFDTITQQSGNAVQIMAQETGTYSLAGKNITASPIVLVGSSGADALVGSPGVVIPAGLSGDGVLAGDSGGVIIDGVAGAGHLIGGAGDDTFVFHPDDTVDGEIMDGGDDFDRLVVSDNNRSPFSSFSSIEELYLNSGVTNVFLGY